MKRLTYQKYKGSDNILTIDLHNGYTIIAIKSWNKDKQNYNVELRLKENSIGKWDLIDDAENLVINANYKTINLAILRRVSDFVKAGLIDYCIQLYEYELKCFERGNELFERERLSKK